VRSSEGDPHGIAGTYESRLDDDLPSFARDVVNVARYEHDGVIVAVAAWGRDGEPVPVGSSAPYRGRNLTSDVLRTGHPVRVDDYGEAFGTAADRVRALGLRAGVGAPIVLERPASVLVNHWLTSSRCRSTSAGS
jgi:hypothetical protein